MNKLSAHIRILRPLNLAIGAFVVIITASMLHKMDELAVWLTALCVVVFYNAAANLINDYLDIDTDRINRPKRPLVTGEVKPRTAFLMAIILFISGTILASFLPSMAAIIAIAVAMPIMIFYSIGLKGLALVGNIVIAFILGLTFLFAGAALNNMEAMVVPALLAFGLTITRELVKDIGDIEGDRKATLKTFPIVAGEKKAWILSALFAILIGVGAIIPYTYGVYNHWYLIFVLFGVEIPLFIIVVSTMKFPTNTSAIRGAKLLKFSTIAGVLAVWLGSL